MDRAQTLIVVVLLAALAVAVFSLPGLAILAFASNSSTADTMLDRPGLVAGIGSGTFLAVLLACLAALIRLSRVRPPVDVAEPGEPPARI